MRTFGCIALLLSAPAVLAATGAPQPRLELGLGALALYLPDYRGSDDYGARFLPVPYVVYRSERLQVTREGLRAWLFAGERLSFSLSAAASLNGNRDDNPLRAGMPELDPTFEIGPSLDWRLYNSADGEFRTRLRLPLRAVAATDFRNFENAGWVLSPNVQASLWQDRDGWGMLHSASLGPQWASEKYHQYFYGVEPQFMTDTRPAYDAPGGYGGTRLTLSSGFQRERWRFGIFASYDWLRGAVFDDNDSPLFENEHSVVSGVYLTYRLYQSGVAAPGSENESP